jgi:ribosomal protein S18 acetylase RimI-like enzyme
MQPPTIRRYRADDYDAVYDVCIRTGSGGQGARGLYSSDDLLPDMYAGPYLELEPAHAYVLDDGHRAVGYIVGTSDTAGFVAAYRARWLPRMTARYLLPEFQGAGHGRDLMGRFLASVAAAGAGSCYLAVGSTNTGARRFYTKLGWRELSVRNSGTATFLIRSTAP